MTFNNYNKALVGRGSLVLWFDKNAIEPWYLPNNTAKRGRPKLYSNMAIECCLGLKAIFHLPLRATEGLVNSLFGLLGPPLLSPDYTCMSKRQKSLSIKLPKRKARGEKMHLVIDSTGLKLFGEGEWKIRKHGQEKKRRWLKLHLAVNENSHDIGACMLTGDNVHDAEMLPALLGQIDEGTVGQVTGDGAYDTHGSYAVTLAKGAAPCFPPRVNARRHKPEGAAWIARNQAVSHVFYKGLKNFGKRKTIIIDGV